MFREQRSIPEATTVTTVTTEQVTTVEVTKEQTTQAAKITTKTTQTMLATTRPAETTTVTTNSSVLNIPAEWTTDAELYLIASVVMNEAGNQCYDGKVAVAQCIRNACIKQNKPFSQCRYMYGYTKTRTPTEAVQRAVNDVFLSGVTVTSEPILFYYNPAYGYSSFHESQVYVMTIQEHRFFKEK